MSFKPPLPRLAGPHNLPTLLSFLPKNGQYSLIKPSNCRHPDRVFLVTRSKVKYTSTIPAPVPAAVEALKSGGKVTAVQKEVKRERVKDVKGVVGEDSVVRARGKAWAMEFRDGKFVPPSIPSKLPDPLIPRAFKSNWIQIAPSSLPAETAAAVQSWKSIQESYLSSREQALSAREEVARVRRNKHRQERREVIERIENWKEDAKKVKIVY